MFVPFRGPEKLDTIALLNLFMKLKLVVSADTTAAMGTEVSCGNAGQNVVRSSTYRNNAAIHYTRCEAVPE